jgi:hypothetical protein
MVVCRCGDGTHLTSGQPHLSLGLRGVVAEVELILRQRLPPLQAKDKHGGGVRREVEKLL